MNNKRERDEADRRLRLVTRAADLAVKLMAATNALEAVQKQVRQEMRGQCLSNPPCRQCAYCGLYALAGGR